MAEVIEDPKIREFVHSSISKEFGLTIDEIAEQCRGYGRFSAWLNDDINQIKQVLTIVKDSGVSPAFFASYERTEGYNSQWGWLNHTSQQGDYFQDAQSVSNWIVEQSTNTTDNPAWIDFANYKDFVPESVKQAGNEDFANMTSGSIGKVIIAGTAAATWEVYYPQGLLEEYNGVQDYGTPIAHMVQYIEEWGGSVTGDDPDPNPDPDPEPEPEPEPPPEPIITIDFTPITEFFDGFMQDFIKIVEDLINEIVEEFIKIIERILEEIEKMLTVDLYNYGSSYTQGNNFLKLTKQLENMNKIKPTLKFFEILNEIKEEGERIINDKINSGYDKINDLIDAGKNLLGDVIDSIVPDISYPDPEPEPEPDPDPEPSGDKYFPVDYSQSGVNFWKKSNWSMGDLQYEMCYGYTRNGGSRFHAGYDIGSGGVTGLGVYATNDGIVQFARWSDSAGFMVQIKHDEDEYYSTYMHLVTDSNVVNSGDKVKAGQKIATMGNTPGGGMAVHLHYVLSTDGATSGEATTIDPENYLGITDDNTTSLPKPN